jgi:TrmH RNA methyltransferase
MKRPPNNSRTTKRPPQRAPVEEPPRGIYHDKSLVKFYGVQACKAIYARRAKDIKRVFVAHKLAIEFNDLQNWCSRTDISFKISDPQELERVAATAHHEGICIEAKPVPLVQPNDLFHLLKARGQFVVAFLERVENPHNVGAILRTCGFFGVDAVVMQSKEMKSLSGALCRVAEGAAEILPICIVDRFDRIEPLFSKLQIELVAATPHEAESVFTSEWSPKSAIAFGAEGPGLSKSVLESAVRRVAVPGVGQIESLNVASAVAVVLSDYSRRRKALPKIRSGRKK